MRRHLPPPPRRKRRGALLASPAAVPVMAAALLFLAASGVAVGAHVRDRRAAAGGGSSAFPAAPPPPQQQQQQQQQPEASPPPRLSASPSWQPPPLPPPRPPAFAGAIALAGEFDAAAAFAVTMVVGSDDGGRLQLVNALVDTGSVGLTARCQANKSATARVLQCGVPADVAAGGARGLCGGCAAAGGDVCTWRHEFSEGSTVEGVAVEDYLALLALAPPSATTTGTETVPLGRAAFGCHTAETGAILADTAAGGVLGLGQGRPGAPGLLPRLVASGGVDVNAFSLELREAGGALLLGTPALAWPPAGVEGGTPLGVNPRTGWYEVRLAGAAVDAGSAGSDADILRPTGIDDGSDATAPRSKQQQQQLLLQPRLRREGDAPPQQNDAAVVAVIVDSGSSFSYLHDDLLAPLVERLRAAIPAGDAEGDAQFRVLAPPEAPDQQTLCVAAATAAGGRAGGDPEAHRAGLPGVTLHFDAMPPLEGAAEGGGSPPSPPPVLRLGPVQLWHSMEWYADDSSGSNEDAAAGSSGSSSSVLCLGLFPASLAGGRAILGASALLGRRFVFDVDGGSLEWDNPSAGGSGAVAPGAGQPGGASAQGRRLLLEDARPRALQSNRDAPARRGLGAPVAAGLLTGLCLAATVLCARLACVRYSAHAAARRYAQLQATGLTPEEIDGLTFAEQQGPGGGTDGGGAGTAGGLAGSSALGGGASGFAWARRVLQAVGLTRAGGSRYSRSLRGVDAAFALPGTRRGGRGGSAGRRAAAAAAAAAAGASSPAGGGVLGSGGGGGRSSRQLSSIDERSLEDEDEDFAGDLDDDEDDDELDLELDDDDRAMLQRVAREAAAAPPAAGTSGSAGEVELPPATAAPPAKLPGAAV